MPDEFAALLNQPPALFLRFAARVPHFSRCICHVVGCCPSVTRVLYVVRACAEPVCADRLIYYSSVRSRSEFRKTVHDVADFTADTGEVESVRWLQPIGSKNGHFELRVLQDTRRSTFCLWLDKDFHTLLVPDAADGIPASCPKTDFK